MRVIRATTLGMCFGVRDAVAIVLEQPRPREVTIRGELVHNPVVLETLEARGFRSVAEGADVVATGTPTVLVTAHGTSNAERARLRSTYERLVDTTCPLVRGAHDAALELAAEGRHVIVIGKPGHIEVRGLVGDLPHHDVVPDVGSVRRWGYARLGVICQTTVPESRATEVVHAIRARNPRSDVRFIDTICAPTKQRVAALDELARRCSFAVVVGGANSNNTGELARDLEERGVHALRVASADELDPEWFRGVDTVGLTAGTSTLDATIDAVERALLALPVTATAT